MTFMHKLSCRLALLKDRVAIGAMVLAAGAALFACEKPVALTDLTSGSLARLVVVPSAVRLFQGQTTRFTAVGLMSTGDTAWAGVSVSWTTTGGAIVDTTSSGGEHYGEYRAPQPTGQYKVVATASATGPSDTAIVTVAAVPVAAVSVTPAAASVVVGGAVQLSATPLDSAGNGLTGRAATWGSSNPNVATVDGSGLVTGATGGTATITATVEGKSGVSSITVSTVPVASVSVSPASANLQQGQTVQLAATPRDAAGNPLTGRAVSWVSSNSSAATVSGSGLVTGVGGGTATITASSEGHAGTATIVVTAVPVTSVSVSPASASVPQGQTVQLTATPRDASGNALSGRAVTWTSSNTSVATVTNTGRVSGVTAGSATITATSEGQAGTAAITVTTVPVASVTVSPGSAALLTGQTIQLTATPKDAGGNALSGRVVSWATSNGSVATVTTSGLVIGVAAGAATITATSEGKSGTALVTVVVPGPAAGCTPTGSGVCYYVDGTAGNDANAGDSAHAFRTIQHAADIVNPGDWVVVRNGVYTGGSTVLTIGRGGTSTGLVVFAAQNEWGAVIDGQNNTSTIGVRFNASYVRLQGFEVRGTLHGLDLATSAHDIQIAQNHIHDIGRICTSTTSGQSGIYSESTNLLVEQNVINDIGRFGEGENGCSYGGSDVWVNHDHGIYLKGTNIIIRNNVFYHNVHGWSVHMYGASVNQVYIVNNTFAFPNPNRIGHIIISEPISNSVIANNIFYQPTTAGVRFSSADGGSASNVTVENNLTLGGTAVDIVATGMTLSNNLNNTDPLLVNASALDFHLRAGSPAIGAGISLPYVTNDFDGVSRPQGAPYAIGAYQFK